MREADNDQPFQIESDCRSFNVYACFIPSFYVLAGPVASVGIC